MILSGAVSRRRRAIGIGVRRRRTRLVLVAGFLPRVGPTDERACWLSTKYFRCPDRRGHIVVSYREKHMTQPQVFALKNRAQRNEKGGAERGRGGARLWRIMGHRHCCVAAACPHNRSCNTKNDSSLYTSTKNSAATIYALYEMSLNRISHARCDM